MNKEYYLNFIHWLRDVIQRKQTQLWATGDWQIHVNASTYALHLMQSFLAKYQLTQVAHPPLRPDLASCDFRLLPKLKSRLKGKKIQTVDEIHENTVGQLRAIPTKDFAECFEQWKRCWENCVRSQSAYLKETEVSLSYVQCIFYHLQ